MADKSPEGIPPTAPLHKCEPEAPASTASVRQEGSTDIEATERLTAPYTQSGKGKVPTRIGRYKILQVIASGGMGTVYEAEQEQPQRTVALKVIKSGIASPEHLRRFEYESQLLARLKHPAIAEVYDAGTHGDGDGDAATPFFVMELVPDARLVTQYTADVGLDLRDKLELFCCVCDGIAHGHSRGIIHRDIKPQNILVDPDGNPKVIDFGVARMTDVDNYAATQQTEVGQLVGTLQYMSPEQTEADPRDLDIRSDVYSLGLLLYEMLTSRRPYEVSRSNIFEATRIVREQPPVPPGKVNPRLCGDVETIVLKALAKNRVERYQTAESFSADVRRFLHNEPITARPPNVLYQLQKFAQRNKPLVAGMTAAAAALLVGLVVSTWMYLVADDARKKTDQARRDAVDARQEAEDRRDEAETAKTDLAAQLTETKRARDAQRIAKEQAEIESSTRAAVNEYLNRILGAASPYELGRNVTVAEALDDASAGIDTAFVDQPRVEAEVRMTLGRTYHNLGKYDQAEPHFRRAAELWEQIAGPDDRETLYAKHRLVRTLDHLDRDEEGAKLQQEVYETQLRVFGEDNEDTRDSMIELAEIASEQGEYEKAEQLLRRVMASQRRTLSDESPLVLKATDAMAEAIKTGRSVLGLGGEDKALLDAQRIILRGEHPDTLSTMSRLAGVLMDKGELKDAEAIYRQVYDARQEYYGDDSPSTLSAMRKVGDVLREQGEVAEAQSWYARAYTGRTKVLGLNHPDTLGVAEILFEMYLDDGSYQAAEQMARRLWSGWQQSEGSSHPATLFAIRATAKTQQMQEKFVDAERTFRTLLDQAPTDPKLEQEITRHAVNGIADALLGQGKYNEAEPYFVQVVAAREKFDSPTAILTLKAKNSLAVVLQNLTRDEEALPLFQELAPTIEETFGEHHVETLAAKKRLGLTMRRLDRLEEADVIYRQVLAGQTKTLGHQHAQTLMTHNSLGNILRDLGKCEEAEKVHREVLAIRTKVLGGEHVQTLYTMDCLAQDLEELGKIDEAQSFYQRALAGRRKVLGTHYIATLDSFGGAMRMLLIQGRNKQAEALARNVLAELEKKVPADNIHLPINRQLLVHALLAQQKAADAEPLVRQNILIWRKHRPNDDPDVLFTQSNLACCLLERGKPAEAEELLRAILRQQESADEDLGRDIARTKARLGRALLHQKQFAGAEPLLTESLPELCELFGDQHFETVFAHRDIVDLYTRWEKPDKLAEFKTLLVK